MKTVMKYLVPFVIAIGLLATGLAATIYFAAEGSKTSRAAFHDAMRKLWEDHITWTRLYIVSATGDLPDKDPTAGRLLQNQADIGNAVKSFYGGVAGDQLTVLLREHILLAAQLIDAAKKGDNASVADLKNQWYANADQIAVFLNKANPKYWPLDDMTMMMHSHLDLTLKEAVARLNGDYTGDIAAYDEVHAEILQMADMLSDGIIKQFPHSFKK